MRRQPVPKRISPLGEPPNVHRLPPHSMEAEQGVIGSVLAGSDYRPQESQSALLEAQERISGQHFYVPANRTIWETLVSMEEQKKPLGTISLTQELTDRNLLQSVGGAQYVTHVGTFVPTATNIVYYLDVMREKFALRQIVALGGEAVRKAYEEQDDVPGLIDEVQQNFTAIALSKLDDSPLKHIKDELDEVVEEIENAFRHRGRTRGLATGFADLDRMTNGLLDGELYVLAARPSVGKTTFAMNIAEYVASPRVEVTKSRKTGKLHEWKYPGFPVAVFSLETSRYRLVKRMLCGRAHINLKRLRDGHLAQAGGGKLDYGPITKAVSALIHTPIYIDYSPSLRLADFKSRARFAVAKLKAKLLIVDYVQLMTAGGKKSDSPYERAMELTAISRTIKQVGGELNVPVIAIAQLNREPEKSKTGRPRMSHLRECGAFEQDADHVWLLWRAENYAEDDEEKKELEGQAELHVAKNKDGPTEDVKLTFLKDYTRFESRARDDGSMPEMFTNDPKRWQDDYREDERDEN
jgi:replicative DNA helicase